MHHRRCVRVDGVIVVVMGNGCRADRMFQYRFAWLGGDGHYCHVVLALRLGLALNGIIRVVVDFLGRCILGLFHFLGACFFIFAFD